MSELEPALSPEEWQALAPLDGTLADRAMVVLREDPHAAAAMALHHQPFGFTWDDYYELLDNAHEIEEGHGPPEFLVPERKRQVDALRSIARRIAALLPPRDREG